MFSFKMPPVVNAEIRYSSRSRNEPLDADQSLKFLRWTLIVAFDIVTEFILVSLSVFLVWPLQMSVQLKAQTVLAFAFRLP